MSKCSFLRDIQVFILPFFSFFLGACTNEDPIEQNNSQSEVFVRDTVSTDFGDGGFTSGVEGPVADNEGNLFAVNYLKEGTIGRLQPDGTADVFVELPNGSVGNGLRFSSAYDSLFVADYVNHQILVILMADKRIEVYAMMDEQLNQPNDIAITSNGRLFASDPNWSSGTGNLWTVGHDRKWQLIEASMGTTNGVEVAPGDTRLYVNESVQRRVWVYDLNEFQMPVNKRLFYEFPDYGLDGMRCDAEGNLYIARYGKGTIAILDTSGELLGEVDLIGEKPTNIAFGGADGRTCFVTMQHRKRIEQFQNSIPGRSFLQ